MQNGFFCMLLKWAGLINCFGVLSSASGLVKSVSKEEKWQKSLYFKIQIDSLQGVKGKICSIIFRDDLKRPTGIPLLIFSFLYPHKSCHPNCQPICQLQTVAQNKHDGFNSSMYCLSKPIHNFPHLQQNILPFSVFP